MQPDLRFPRQARLKSRKAIDALFQSGKRVHTEDWRAFYLFRPSPGIQIGVGAPSRNFKKAVDRNRVKRLIREAYRIDQQRWKDRLQEKQQGMDLFILYTGKQLPDFSSVQKGLIKLVDKIFI
jgi:ribonuclease P protein component